MDRIASRRRVADLMRKAPGAGGLPSGGFWVGIATPPYTKTRPRELSLQGNTADPNDRTSDLRWV
jgi:hypothetical protein